MATQLTEFHYHLTQGSKTNQFDFEDKNFDVKNIYNFYLRKVSTNWIGEKIFKLQRDRSN